MKRVLSLLLTLVMVFSLIPVAAFADGNAAISFETTFAETMTVGDTFTVTANLANNPGMATMTVSLKWNEDAVKFNGFETEYDEDMEEDVLVTDVFKSVWEPVVNYDLGIITASRTKNTTKSGTLFVANFEIVGSGDLEIALKDADATEFEMANADMEDIAVTFDYSAIENLSVAAPEPEGPEIPTGAPFTAVTTDAGAAIAIEQQDDVGDVPYYIITIPEDATTAYVTAPNQVVMADWTTGEMQATAYVAEVESGWNQLYISFDYETTADGPKVEIPMNMTASDMYGGETELCFVEDEYGDLTHAFGIEDANYACLGYISFRYGRPGGEDAPTTYKINIDEDLTGGTVSVMDANMIEITKAAAGDDIFLANEPEEGYQFKHYLINGVAVTEAELGMTNGFYTMPAADVTISAVFEALHTCSYDQENAADKYQKSEATCQSGAVYYKSCTCGEFATTAETFVFGEKVDHDYVDGVCKWCGEAATEPILSFTAGGQTLEAVTAEDYCSEFEVTVQKLTVTVPAGVNTVTINCAASMCAYIDHVSSDLSPSGKSAEIDLTQDLTFVCVPVTLDDGSDAYYHVYFEQEAGDVDPEPEDPAVTPGYSFATSADGTAENGGTAVFYVKITGNSDSEVTTYNAYDVALTFTDNMLELATNADGEYIVSGAVADDNGEVVVEGNTIHIVGCGGDKNFEKAIAELIFNTKAEGEAIINVTNVQISDDENAAVKDAPAATAMNAAGDADADDTPAKSVISVPYSVDKPDYVIGADKVLPGADYIFRFANTENYTYEIEEINIYGDVLDYEEADGQYTVHDVYGKLTILVKQTPKSYDVTKPGNVNGPDQATYGKDYKFTVTPTEGKEIESVTVTVNGNAYSCTINQEGAYVIKGEDISGVITITVTEKDKEVPVVKYTNITFSGITAEEIEGGQLTQKVEAGNEFTFKLIKTEGVTYTVKIGEEVLTANEDGSYTIPAAKMIEGNLTVTIEKAENINVEVTEYIKLDGQSMFLITAKSAATDSVLKYGEEAMYRSSKYEAYSWLVISTDSAEVVKAAAETAITIAKAGTTAPAVEYGFDVNGTSKVDVNDAQLVYDMYNASYDAFTENLTVKKFLEADVDGSKNLGTQDVATIINYIVNQNA